MLTFVVAFLIPFSFLFCVFPILRVRPWCLLAMKKLYALLAVRNSFLFLFLYFNDRSIATKHKIQIKLPKSWPLWTSARDSCPPLDSPFSRLPLSNWIILTSLSFLRTIQADRGDYCYTLLFWTLLHVFICISWPVGTFTLFRDVLVSPIRLGFLLFLRLSSPCLCAALLCPPSASSLLYYSQLWLSLLWSGGARAKKARVLHNSNRLLAGPLTPYTRL